jgi:MFS family permease
MKNGTRKLKTENWRLKTGFGALRHRDFRILWIGLLASNSGTWARNIAQGWLLYQISNSRLMLGLLALSFALPMTTLPLFGGVIADRFNRLSVLKCTQSLATMLAAILSWLTFTGQVTTWHVIGLSFLGAIVLSIDNPTRQAVIPALVPREDLPGAMALNGIVFTGAGLIGSAIAGMILHRFEGEILKGTAIVFILNAISYLAVLVPLFSISPIEKGARRSNDLSHSALKDLKAGIIYLRAHPILTLIISISAATNLFGRSFLQLMPILARDVLDIGAGGLGAMHTAASAGTLAGGFGLAAIGGAQRQKEILTYSLLFLIASTVALALSHWYWVSLVVLGINGAVGAVAAAAIATSIQTNVEEGMRGRMMSYYTLTIIGFAPLGSGIAGMLAQWMPVQFAIISPAGVLLLFLFWVIFRSPVWQKLQ